jgi:type I restriction-modification system DNA methylase subunit
MPQNYKCGICDSKPDQLSHHKSHLYTQKHIDKTSIFRLKLQTLSSTELQTQYNATNIDEIINKQETIKLIKIIKKKPETQLKKTISGETIWNLETNQDLNPNYANIKSKLDSVIKKCHDLLYSKGGSIVGTKAQNDIMRLLCLKILQSQFSDENSELWERCNQVKSNENMSDTQFVRFKLYCNDITEITKKDDVFKEWRIFVNKYLSKVFPSIYYENDNKFNCDKIQCICELIRIIDSLDINEEFKDAFSTTCGDIHESFRSYGGKNSGAKALGQFFTPRHLIHLMFHGIGLDKLIEPMEDITIYDPCMGTGGFLTRLLKMCNIPSKNIYGCETEIDTIKFGEMSMVLTSGNSRNNIIKCDSLCENEFILYKKFSCIVTNPPFGTSMKYQDLKATFESKFPNSPDEFEEIYPLKTNNGACLFVQHCVYMLAEGGFCAIVLPDGELFEGNSKWSKTFRKWLSEHVNIRTILKVASGTFEHAGVKTNVVVFTKDGPTQKIHFMETAKECNVVKDMFTISSEELKSAGYSLDVGEYLVDETDNYDVPMVELGDLCSLKGSGKTNSKDIDNDGSYPFYRASFNNPSGSHSNYDFDGDKYILIVKSGGSSSKPLSYNYGIGKVFLVEGKVAANVAVFKLEKINDNININYLYRYLLTHQLDIQKLAKYATNNGNIDMVKLMKFKIPLPSQEVQQQCIALFEEKEKFIQSIDDKINSEKEYITHLKQMAKDVISSFC